MTYGNMVGLHELDCSSTYQSYSSLTRTNGLLGEGAEEIPVCIHSITLSLLLAKDQ